MSGHPPRRPSSDWCHMEPLRTSPGWNSLVGMSELADHRQADAATPTASPRDGMPGRDGAPVADDGREDEHCEERGGRDDGTSLRARMLRDPGVPTAYRLNYVANRFTAALYAEMGERSGLDRARFVVMLCLDRAGEATAQEIADATHRPKNSLSRAIRQLEADGLVRRRTDPDDARRQPMCLTKSGQGALDAAWPIAREHERRMLDPLTADEVEQLDALLGKLAR